MPRKQRKSPQQTFEVSQKDLESYYSKYLPGFAPGGAYRTQPYRSSAMHATTGGRLAGFMDRVARGVGNAVKPKPPRPSVNKRDYQKTTITNNTNQDQYYDFDDGSVETKNVAMAEGINGALGMDAYLTDLQQVKGADGKPVFSESYWNRDTGEVDYLNPAPNARTEADIANQRISDVQGTHMNLNNGVVESYYDGTQNVAYDSNAPLTPPPVTGGTTVTTSQSDPVVTQGSSTQEQRNNTYNTFCEQNPDQCPERKYGGGLPRFQIGGGDYEVFFPDPYEEESNNQATEEYPDLEGIQDIELPDDVVYDPTPVGNGINNASGMFNVNQDLGLPTPPAPAINMQEPSFSDQLWELGNIPQYVIPEDAEKIEPQQGTIDQDVSWGDTFGQQVRNRGKYVKDKFLDSKLVRGFSGAADLAVEGAGIFNDWFDDRRAEAREIQGISGTTTNAMAAVKSADADGLYGNYGQNIGKLRPGMGEGVDGRFAKRGLEMYQDKGEFSQQPEHDTALLRQFLQMSEPTFQFSQNAIEDQKKSLGQMKHGGQVLDLDEGLIQELIAAGADIKIL